MNIARALKEQIESQIKLKNDPKNQAARITAEALGIVARAAVDGIKQDISDMVNKDLSAQLDGYVLSLSRIMSHDLAWECIVQGFNNHKKEPPNKYYSLFHKSSPAT